MSKVVKCGLIQATHACSTDEPLETIKEANIAKHVPLIEKAAGEGVQILCMQEIFTGPYFCAEQTPRWYDSTEPIPDGPTTRLMQDLAKQHSMVIVVPIAIVSLVVVLVVVGIVIVLSVIPVVVMIVVMVF